MYTSQPLTLSIPSHVQFLRGFVGLDNVRQIGGLSPAVIGQGYQVRGADTVGMGDCSETCEQIYEEGARNG
jgi:hypothetical protein